MLIEDLIPGTNIENHQIEFKRCIEEGKSEDSGKAKEIGWLKTLVAFANSQGGDMYIGVDNATHAIVPLNHDTADRIVLMVHRQIKQRVEPAILYDIDSIDIPDTGQTKYVLKISVKANSVLPVTLHEENLLGIYIRRFGSTVLASNEQIRDLVLLSDHNPFDRPFTDEHYSPEDFYQLHKLYRERNGKELTDKALISAGFISSENKLSKGAVLFKDKYNDEQTKIVCTLWPGDTKGSSVILASKEITGNLLEAISEAIEFVNSHSTKGFKKVADTRIDYYSYPARSVTEGIVNAVAHRNYFIFGSQIEVNLFIDRLEITSPGSLLGVAMLNREKNISSIIPRRRNEVICMILEYCRYMESKGSGFDKIENDYAGKGDNHRPYISSDGNSFTLVLPNLTYEYGVLDENSIPKVHVMGLLSSKKDEAVLSFCYKKAHTAAEIAEYLNQTPSTYFRKEVLAKLVNQGYLLEDSGKKPAVYRANPATVMV